MMLPLLPNTSVFRLLLGNFLGDLFTLLLVMTLARLVWHLVTLLHLFIYTVFLWCLCAHFSVFIGSFTILFIGGAANWFLLVLADLMIFSVTHILGDLFTLVVVLGDMGQMLVILAYLTLLDTLVLWHDDWHILAFFFRDLLARLFGDRLTNWHLIFLTFLLGNLVADCFWHISTLFFRFVFTGWLVGVVARFAHLSVDCLAVVLVLLFTHLSVHSFTLVSVLIMAAEHLLCLAHLVVLVLADLFVVVLAHFHLVVPTHVRAKKLINSFLHTFDKP